MIDKNITNFLFSLRHLFCENISPEMVKDVEEMKNYDTKMIFPCEVVELRDILKNKEIRSDNNEIFLISFRFAEKYLKKFPVFLVIDSKKIREEEIYSKENYSIKIYKTNKIDIDNSLVKVIINEPVEERVKKDIINIIKENIKNLEYYVSNSIPGISSFNSKGEKMNWYKIANTLNNDTIFNDEIKIMDRHANFPYKEGDKVRKRGIGLAMKQLNGEVVSIENNIMKIKWEDDKITKFDINRPEFIHATVEKI